MAQDYQLVFWRIDPAHPPAAGSWLAVEVLTVHDHDGDGWLRSYGGDRINGEMIVDVWAGDTITVQTPGGPLTVTGTTFYLDSDPHPIFIPTDGTVPFPAVFQSSTWVTVSTGYRLPDMPVPCFTPGTLIATPEGPRPVEALVPGDMVLTLDRGARPVRWAGRRAVPGRGRHAPVRFAPGAIGNRRELVVSPQHRVLLTGWRAELLFGAGEVLAAAAHLVNGGTIHRAPCDRVDYIHILFDRHEIVLAEGVATESFHPGDYMLGADTAIRSELLALFPELAAPGRGWHTARPVLRRAEARLLAA